MIGVVIARADGAAEALLVHLLVDVQARHNAIAGALSAEGGQVADRGVLERRMRMDRAILDAALFRSIAIHSFGRVRLRPRKEIGES